MRSVVCRHLKLAAAGERSKKSRNRGIPTLVQPKQEGQLGGHVRRDSGVRSTHYLAYMAIIVAQRLAGNQMD